MAQDTSIPAGPFVDRLRSEIHAAHHTCDHRELEFLMHLHALTCVRALQNGKLLIADDFAELAGLARDLLEQPVPRELRRPVTEPPAPEEDLQLGGNQ